MQLFSLTLSVATNFCLLRGDRLTGWQTTMDLN